MVEIKVSNEFKTQVVKTIVSIILFFLTFILILTLPVCFTVYCIYNAILLIMSYPNVGGIVIGIGLAFIGILVLFLLLKFLFKFYKVDRSQLIEVNKYDEPQLFSLIEDIANKVGTSFPKKVYLSSEVNAAVFYDSSFLSMFFPVKKNLLIGMGLVNALTKSELTAVLSHEFAHFSQKTMKVGSYVYYVNKIIFNLLYDINSYDNLIQRWKNILVYFSSFVIIAVNIINGFLWVMKQMYELVNKSYLGLSRKMEFYADEISVNIAGNESVRSALLRSSLIDHSFRNTLSFYEKKGTEKRKPENIFDDHIFVMNFLARENNIEIKYNLPQVSENELNRFDKSKLVIKDQWASHPSDKDRIKMIDNTRLSSINLSNESANLLFSNIERIQRELTNKLFMEVSLEGDCSTISFEQFQSEFQAYFFENNFSNVYHCYYDDKNPLYFDIHEVGDKIGNVEFDDLFSANKVDKVYTAISLKNDIETIKQILYKSLKIKTFDYDGVKYKQKDSWHLHQKLELELGQLNEQIKLNDIKIFMYFKSCESDSENNSTLEDVYKQFFDFDKEFDSKYKIYSNLIIDLNFLNIELPFEQIFASFIRVERAEKKLKNGIRELLENDLYQSEIPKEIMENFDLYLSKDWIYFDNGKYIESNLKILLTAMNNYAFLITRGHFLLKKKLLDYQLELIKAKNK